MLDILQYGNAIKTNRKPSPKFCQNAGKLQNRRFQANQRHRRYLSCVLHHLRTLQSASLAQFLRRGTP